MKRFDWTDLARSVVLLVGAIPNVMAQSTPAAPQKVPVCLFTLSEPGAAAESDQFASTYLKYRLQRVQELDVVPGTNELCRATSSPKGQIAHPVTYRVQAKLRERRSETGGSPEMVLNYELARTADGKDMTLVTETQAFAVDALIEQVSVMAEDVAVSIQENLPGRQGLLVAVEVRPDEDRSKSTAEDLQSLLSSSLSARGMSVRKDASGPPPTFSIDVNVRTRGERIEARPTISAGTQKFEGRPIALTATQRQQFYSNVIQAVISQLDQVRSADRIGVSRLEDASPAALLESAKAFLCTDAPANCEKDPAPALTSLNLLVGRVDGVARGEALVLLGDAHVAARQYDDAADAYERALPFTSVVDRGRRFGLWVKAADAWYEAKNYERAEKAYSSAIAEAPESGGPGLQAVELKRIRTIRLLGAADRALALSLTALERFNADPFRQEAEQIIREWLFASGNALVAQDYNMAVIQLNRIPESQIGSLPTALRAEILRQRAVWARDALREYSLAESTLTAALALDNAPQIRLEMAVTLRERAALAADGEKQTLLQEARRVLLDLLAARFAGAYPELLEVNHQLQLDGETRDAIDDALKSGVSDRVLPMSLMFVCIEYLHDFECGLRGARALERLNPTGAALYQLSIAEAKLLARQHAEAYKDLQVVIDEPSTPLAYRAVAQFYELWALAATGRTSDAEARVAAWQADVARLDAVARTAWVFGGARVALASDSDLPAEWRTKLSALIPLLEPRQPGK